MAIIRLQTETEKQKGIFYQCDTDTPPIGEGGMGKVCEGLCVNERNGSTRPVAIKFMYDDLPPSAYERARREASIQLRNDNLVEMLGFIETQDILPTGEVRKHYHVISELLTGVSLSDVLEGKTKDRTGEDVPFAVKMFQDYKNNSEHFAKIVVFNVLSGLMALHDAGYIHRDIDPSNIMLTADGHLKLIDFGIAKQMNTLTTGDKALTVAGKFMGKPEYAAPELALGDIQHQNQTTDIYAVGILLYQCLIGHPPFDGSRYEILEKQIKAKIPLENVKNKALRKIIATACEKKQELRFQTSAQMRVALETMNVSKPKMSKKSLFVLVSVAVALLVLLFGTVFIVKQKQDKARMEAEQARIEQLNAEALSAISLKIDEADRLYSLGMSKENDDYEQQLMGAYKLYKEAETSALENVELDMFMDDILRKEKEVLCALDSAKTELANQSLSLSEIGEIEMAGLFRERVNSIDSFIQTNKK